MKLFGRRNVQARPLDSSALSPARWIRELETFFVRAHDRQLDDVPDTRCFRRFDGVDFELRLVQHVRPEQERLVAALERRPQRFRALVVDGGRFDSSRTASFAFASEK